MSISVIIRTLTIPTLSTTPMLAVPGCAEKARLPKLTMVVSALVTTPRAVADPERRIYAAFGVDRGNVLQMFGPAVWKAKRRAEAKGHGNGERVGDIWMMPGTFLVRGDRVIWAHRHRHAADHPDFARIPELARVGL